jgi:repressor of nif and glnA expression
VEEYKKMIKTIFQESNETYGVDRICGELRKRGKTASYHRVKGFMDDMGLHSIHKRRRQKSLTDSRKARGDEYAPTLINLKKRISLI